MVTWADRYGENDETYSSETPFYFLGETGDNFTGASLNGFEVTKNNIIVAGVAQPHNYKIKGTKGFERYSKNLFVTITSRKTGKSTVKWLTKLDPKKKKEAAGVWMKKLTDDRLALIYFIRNNDTDKSTFYYMVIDENGKKIYKKTLKGVTTPSTRDLILKDGRIWWFTHTSDYQDATYKNGVYKINNVKVKSVFYGIPAVCN